MCYADTQKSKDDMSSPTIESSSPVIVENGLLHPLSKQPTSSFLYPEKYEGHLEGVLITNADIKKRTMEIAKRIHLDYKYKRPCLVCVLKGSYMFFHELLASLQSLRQLYTVEFIRVISYEGCSSTGAVNISNIDMDSLKGKDVILVEDIVDTGKTLTKLMSKLENEANINSLEVCSLLVKRLHTDNDSSISGKTKKITKYVGFSIPDLFVIGYGLDCNEWYRDLSDIWVISKNGEKFALS